MPTLCGCKTNDGKPCSRAVKPGATRCWQHARGLRQWWKSIGPFYRGVAQIIGLVGSLVTILLAVQPYLKTHLHNKSETVTNPIQSNSPAASKLLPPKDAAPKDAAPKENVYVPPLHGTDQFVTYVVLYADNSVLCMMNSNFARNLSCAEVRDAFKKHMNGDVISSLSVALQHYMVPLVYSAGTGGGTRGGSENGRFTETQVAPIVPPEFVSYLTSKVLDISDSKERDFYPFWFAFGSNEPLMKLPKDTKVFFLKKEESEGRPKSYITRLERKGYYQIDFAVYQYAAPRIGAIPDKSTVPDWVNTSQATTYSFVVREDWTLERSHGASFAVEDYDNWAKQLSASIRTKLED